MARAHVFRAYSVGSSSARGMDRISVRRNLRSASDGGGYKPKRNAGKKPDNPPENMPQIAG